MCHSLMVEVVCTALVLVNNGECTMKKLTRSVAFLGNSAEEREFKDTSRPDWKCFCCHDTGLVNPNLVKLVIGDYDYYHDRQPVCQWKGCQASDKKIGQTLWDSDSLDDRFDSDTCREIHDKELENWFAWEENARERLAAAKEAVVKFVGSFGG